MNYETIASQNRCIKITTAKSFTLGSRITVKVLLCKILLVFLFLISHILPLIIYLKYIADAETRGIQLAKGCHGPGVFFSFMSGFLFLLLFRFFYLPFKYPKDDLER